MMARNKSRNPVIVFTFVLIFLDLSLSSHSPQGKLSRFRRQACEEYTYEGRTCCKCGAGLKLKEHCSTDNNNSKCEECEDGTYNPLPNIQTTCEPCKSCSQPSANLVEAMPCTRTKDAVCKCKNDHYCISDILPCTECRPCKVCDPDVGVKVKCSPTNNTICNETNKQKGIVPAILIPLAVVVAVAVIAGVFFWRKRKTGSRNLNLSHSTNGVTHPDMEMEPLNVSVDLTPHIPALAPEIGWTDMRNIAMSSNIPNGTIEAIEQDYPQDSQERTIRLLRYWAEMEGKEGSRKLIQCLRNTGKKGKAEKVKEILSNSNNSPSSV